MAQEVEKQLEAQFRGACTFRTYNIVYVCLAMGQGHAFSVQFRQEGNYDNINDASQN